MRGPHSSPSGANPSESAADSARLCRIARYGDGLGSPYAPGAFHRDLNVPPCGDPSLVSRSMLRCAARILGSVIPEYAILPVRAGAEAEFESAF